MVIVYMLPEAYYQVVSTNELSLAFTGYAGFSVDLGEEQTLLIDPVFSNLAKRPFRGPAPAPDADVGSTFLRRVDHILLTHAHIDHIFDTPVLVQRFGARVIAPPDACDLLEYLGVPRNQMAALAPGRQVRCGELEITALPGKHPRLLGMPILKGTLNKRRSDRYSVSWYPSIEQFGYRLAFKDHSIDFWGDESSLPDTSCDILVLRPYLPVAYMAEVLKRAQPRTVIPAHLEKPFGAPWPLCRLVDLLHEEDMAKFAKKLRRCKFDGTLLVPEKGRRYAWHELLR